MSAADAIWGIVVIASGVFISVYGSMLFRFALAFMGFGLGFLAAMRLFDGQSETTRILIAFALGGIGAIALYSLVKFTAFIAGGILGLVLGFVIVAIIEIWWDKPDGIVTTILIAAAAGLGVFFGRRLGSFVVLLATAAAGAFLIVNGILVLFDSQFKAETTDPTSNLAKKVTLTIFVIFFAVGALSQFNFQRFRQKVIN